MSVSRGPIPWMGEGTPRPGGALSGYDLVCEFLRATEGLPTHESAVVAGVSEATYHRWCRQAPRTLRSSQRVRIERYLGMGPNGEAEVWLG